MNEVIPKFRHRHSPVLKFAHHFTDPGVTLQSFKEECDVNNILKTFEKTGELPNMIKAEPSYGDFSDVKDYQESLNIVLHAREQFDALSAKVRERFGNDPAKFLEFANDPKSGKELVELGLATKRVEEPPPPAKKQKEKPSEQPSAK